MANMDFVSTSQWRDIKSNCVWKMAELTAGQESYYWSNIPAGTFCLIDGQQIIQAKQYIQEQTPLHLGDPDYWEEIPSIIYYIEKNFPKIITVAPTHDNTSGVPIIVQTAQEPTYKYAGYIYTKRRN